MSPSDYHAKAPLCAAFVKAMREAFGEDQVKVLMVSEGDIQLGRRPELGGRMSGMGA